MQPSIPSSPHPPCLALQAHHHGQRRLRYAASLLILTGICSPCIALTSLIPGHTNNYAECVIRQLEPDIGSLAVEAIEGSCREAFPNPSRRNIMDPRSVQRCYQKHEQRVSHRPAAKALYQACQDYFRNT